MMKKSLGQHFLNNSAAIQKIVAATEIKKGDSVIEIGPGGGAITKPLVAQCQERGAQFYAVEKDTGLVIAIQKMIPAIAGKVEHGDALKLLPLLIERHQIGSSPYIIVGNIPYYITGNLLRIIGELEAKPKRTILMVQKEVAERVSAGPGKMNLLAAATGRWGTPRILFTLKPKDFTPPPEVSSAVIAITPRDKKTTLSDKVYYAFIKAAFRHSRKTLHNNLSESFPELTRIVIKNILEQNNILEGARAQDLSIENLETLAHFFPIKSE